MRHKRRALTYIPPQNQHPCDYPLALFAPSGVGEGGEDTVYASIGSNSELMVFLRLMHENRIYLPAQAHVYLTETLGMAYISGKSFEVTVKLQIYPLPEELRHVLPADLRGTEWFYGDLKLVQGKPMKVSYIDLAP